MYFHLKTLKNYILVTSDRHIAGIIDSILFDEGVFAVQYIVVHTRLWLSDRLVLISPAALGSIDYEDMKIDVRCSKSLIESSPAIDKHAPVSLKRQKELSKHYGWPLPWTGSAGDAPGIMTPPNLPVEPVEPETVDSERDNYPLWRSSEIENYHVIVDGENVGKVEAFIIHTPAWMIHFLVVRCGNIIQKRKLILSHLVSKIDFDQSAVILNLSKEQFTETPDFQNNRPISKRAQSELEAYWQQLKKSENPDLHLKNEIMV